MLSLGIGCYIFAVCSVLMNKYERNNTLYLCVIGSIDIFAWASNNPFIGFFIVVPIVWKYIIMPLRTAKFLKKKYKICLIKLLPKDIQWY